MRKLIAVVCLIILAINCSPDPGIVPPEDMANNKDMTSDTTIDLDASKDIPADTTDASDDDMGPTCVCNTNDACCDGCMATNVGSDCDDGLDCTLETTCQADGTCSGSTGSPCDAQRQHPDCQAAMCDEVQGCSFDAIREGLACDTPAPGTYDGICKAGECVGQKQCECKAEDGPCCDGCLFKPADAECGKADPPRTSCNGSAGQGQCGDPWKYQQFVYLCDGVSAQCSDKGKVKTLQEGKCLESEKCNPRAERTCTPSADCN